MEAQEDFEESSNALVSTPDEPLDNFSESEMGPWFQQRHRPGRPLPD